MAIDSIRSYGGHQALHITFPASQAGGTMQQNTPSGVTPGNNIYGRLMFYFAQDGLDGGTNLPFGVHSHFFTTRGLYGDAGTTMEVALGSAIGFNYWPPGTFERFVGGPIGTTNAWHCLQWALDTSGDPPENHARMWVDGTLIVNVPPRLGWVWAQPWNLFTLGFQTFQPTTNAIDVSIDSFAMSNEMVPCP
jgi:hypothetical protein